MSVINTNYLALVSQNNLTKSQNALGTAIERLSSGLRINSAKDDAAGQAIANRFTANIRGLTQAVRNANDGISIAQTTEGALNEINNNLQRIRELTVQAANGTNDKSDLVSIQDEINQRLKEIDRVSAQTQFNGIHVLGKDANKLSIQVGANDGQTISINLKKVDSKELNLSTFNVTGPVGTTAALVGSDYAAVFGDTTSINATAVSESVDDTLAGRLGIAAAGVSIANTAVKDANNNWFATVTITAANQNELDTLAAKGIKLDDTGTGTFYIALDPAKADTTATANTATFEIDTSTLAFTDLTRGVTTNALDTLDKALATVDGLRSELGAIQNRFESTIANLNNTINNLSAARSRIEDADYAVEVSNMTRAQILQQAGTAVLAQANQVPQTVLSLLR